MLSSVLAETPKQMLLAKLTGLVPLLLCSLDPEMPASSLERSLKLLCVAIDESPETMKSHVKSLLDASIRLTARSDCCPVVSSSFSKFEQFTVYNSVFVWLPAI
jgi:hypothetical protein